MGLFDGSAHCRQQMFSFVSLDTNFVYIFCIIAQVDGCNSYKTSYKLEVFDPNSMP